MCYFEIDAWNVKVDLRDLILTTRLEKGASIPPIRDDEDDIPKPRLLLWEQANTSLV